MLVINDIIIDIISGRSWNNPDDLFTVDFYVDVTIEAIEV
jgi:hypothetical protein